jgi:hypothetical protein
MGLTTHALFFQSASTLMNVIVNGCLALSFLLLLVIAVVALTNKVRESPSASRSWGVRLLVLGWLLAALGIGGYLLGNSLQGDGVVALLTDIAVLLASLGIVLIAAGVITIIVEDIAKAIKGRSK